MFGLSFGELCVLLIVAMVVLGPKDLPRYLRKAGQFAGRLRRMAFEMREKSGIDEVLRAEGIAGDIAEIRKLARGEIAGVVSAVRSTGDLIRPAGSPAAPPGATAASSYAASPYAATQLPDPAAVVVDREREYPREGADSYGALPDTAVVYDGSLPASPLASDALYTRGQAA
ncbi:MAG: Sec-independent protein translocase subunit TatA/TatB [Polyangiaceae bacterium]